MCKDHICTYVSKVQPPIGDQQNKALLDICAVLYVV